MRVLLSAYVCARGVGSEPEVGYNYLRAAAARHDVTVLTHERYAGGLRDAIADGDLRPVEVVAFATPAWTERRLGRLGVGHLDYLIWQARARRYVAQHARRFDVIHHATYGTDWMPSGVVGVEAAAGTPVVWGSVGGIAPVPWRLATSLSVIGLPVELVREFVTRLLRRVVRRDVRRSGALVVARNRETAAYFSAAGADVVTEPQVVALPPPPDVPVGRRDSSVRRALFISRITPWKGPLLAVRALALLGPEWRLEFFGKGRAEGRVRRLAARLGVSERVVFHGHVPKADVLEALRTADVLLFPSMHDSSPMPVAEAGWAGCPVVCLDVAGPPVLIEGTTGVAVPADFRAARRLADAVSEVRRHPPLDRWTPLRLEQQLDSWYQRAVAAAEGSATRSGAARSGSGATAGEAH